MNLELLFPFVFRFLTCLRVDRCSFYEMIPGYFSFLSLFQRSSDGSGIPQWLYIAVPWAWMSFTRLKPNIPAIQLNILHVSHSLAFKSFVLWYLTSFCSSKGCYLFFAMTFWPVFKVSTPISLHWHTENSDILTFTRDESRGDTTWIDGSLALNFPYKCKCHLNKENVSLFYIVHAGVLFM